MTQDQRRFIDAYQAIGYAVSLAAQVEFMCSAIAISIGVDRARVHERPTADVINTIHAKAADSDLAATASDVLHTRGASRLLRTRHTYVHGRLWGPRQPDGFTMSRIMRNGSTYALAVPYSELNKIMDQFIRLIDALEPCMPDGLRRIADN